MNRRRNFDLLEAEHAAKRVLEELYIESIEDLRDLKLIAWQRQRAMIFYESMDEAEGHSLRSTDGSIITVNKHINNEGKRRFVIAHELGHLELHASQHATKLCTPVDMHEYSVSGRETQANVFAAELLMPFSLFEPYCDVSAPSFECIREAADVFQTSITAAAIRFVKLSPERCALVAAEDGRVVWTSRSPSFGHGVLRRGAELKRGSYARDAHRGVGSPGKPEHVRPDVWLPGRVDWSADLFEDVLDMSVLGMTLSLLWIPTGSGL